MKLTVLAVCAALAVPLTAGAFVGGMAGGLTGGDVFDGAVPDYAPTLTATAWRTPTTRPVGYRSEVSLQFVLGIPGRLWWKDCDPVTFAPLTGGFTSVVVMDLPAGPGARLMTDAVSPPVGVSQTRYICTWFQNVPPEAPLFTPYVNGVPPSAIVTVTDPG